MELMNIGILAQEEPVYMGPMIVKLLERHSDDVRVVGIGSMRGGGKPAQGLYQHLTRLLTYGIMLGARGFATGIARRTRYGLSQKLPYLGEGNSVERACERLGIPVQKFETIRDQDLHASLQSASLDVLLNQTDHIIGRDILAIPKLGVINRHGSLLPKNKGRMASYWTHVDGRDYGITVHYVTPTIDSGDIILQRNTSLHPNQTYHDVISSVFEESVEAISDSIKLLSDPEFRPTKMKWGGNVNGFPTLKEAIKHRIEIAKR